MICTMTNAFDDSDPTPDRSEVDQGYADIPVYKLGEKELADLGKQFESQFGPGTTLNPTLIDFGDMRESAEAASYVMSGVARSGKFEGMGAAAFHTGVEGTDGNRSFVGIVGVNMPPNEVSQNSRAMVAGTNMALANLGSPIRLPEAEF
jgi:hypothetical protein